MVTAIAEKMTCKDCGCTFGTDEAKVCIVCNEYTCPNCLTCGCTVKGKKDESVLGENFIRGSFNQKSQTYTET